MDFVLFSFSWKISLHPFICLPADVHHSLHINHQSVAPFSPPPGLNLFTFLSFPFLYRESRLIRRSLGLIFIKGSGERWGEGGDGWLWQLFFIYRTGTMDKWLLVFWTLKRITKRSSSDAAVFIYEARCRDMAENEHSHIITQLHVAFGTLDVRFNKMTKIWNAMQTYFRREKNEIEVRP